MENKKVEILAPAGSYESMTAAVCAGADAVYIGGSRFGARAYANNLDEDAMLRAIDYVHIHGRRLYMTVNTLMKEEELESLFDYLDPFYRQGLDAAIVQDLGVFAFLKEHFPLLPLHASTQMTITGVYGARLLKEMGASRVVTARELSLEEIRRIRDQVDIEIESFVHGALCYCYSGQCLMSSLIGGRSGNRGRCAQTCRLPYEVRQEGKTLNKKDEKYVLSLKDLCTLDLIPDILEAGVYSLKIEGRMKSPRYTAGVVSIYRKYVDRYQKEGRSGYHVEESDKRLLLDLFDRGGFSDGYYREHNGRHMVALKEKPAFREGNQQLFDYLDRTYVEGECREPVEGKVILKENAPAELVLSAPGLSTDPLAGPVCVRAEGQEAQSALNQPITEEKLLKQIGKTGGTPFVFRHLEAEMEGRPFLPVQALNELRRTGLTMLEEAVFKQYRREGGIPRTEEKTDRNDRSGQKAVLTAMAERGDVIRELVKHPDISRIYVDSCQIGAECWKELALVCREKGKECFLSFPQIFRKREEEYFRKEWESFLQAGFDGCLIRSAEEILFLREEMGYTGRLIFDSCLYTCNRKAQDVMRNLGADGLTYPLELNGSELSGLDGREEELVVYGYLPVMVSAQCIRRTVSGCDRRTGILKLKDRLGKEFTVRNCCRFCCNIIYNTAPLSLLGQERRAGGLNPAALRLQFTWEEPEEAVKITQSFAESFLRGKEASLPGEFTRGHFKRGVE